MAGITISALTGSDSAPAKANEAEQKNDIGTAKDQIGITAVNAKTEAYETAYVGNGVTSTDASKIVGQAVIDAVKAKNGTNVGKASIAVEQPANSNATITITTRDFEVEGTITIQDGILTWGEMEELTPGLTLRTISLNLAPGEEGTISYKVRGLSGNVSWASDNASVTVLNGVVSVDSGAEEGTATITASIGEYTKTCSVTIEVKTGIVLTKTAITLEPGGENTIEAQLRGLTTDEGVTWNVTDSDSILTTDISEKNKIKITASAENEGTATITARITAGGTTYTSKVCTITVREEPIKTGKTTATSHNPQDLTALGLTWGELKKIAKSIATNPDIDNDTIEVTAGDKIIGIGDTATVYYNNSSRTVRLLGFNHDTLTSDTSKKAGISFEFTQCLGTAAINPDNINEGGWEGTNSIKCRLNGNTYLGALTDVENGTGMLNYIKPINKEYNTGSTDSYNTIATSTNNSLWFLSCAEIGQNSYSGYNKAAEGTTYAYYANNTADSNRIKQNNDSNTWWWLRSPRTSFSGRFCYVTGNGSLNNYFDADNRSRWGCAWLFNLKFQN